MKSKILHTPLDKNYFLIILLLFVNNCKEEYKPKLDEAQQLLVVDGLLTDESNLVTVRLSNTTPFRDYENMPELGANVSISDDLGRNYILTASSPGTYQSRNFYYEYGRTYTLLIKTKKNKYYKSSPQTLFPKTDLESVSSFKTSKTIQTSLNGKLMLKTLPGLEFLIMLNDSSVKLPFYRFSNIVLVEYTENVFDLGIPPTESGFFYCWKKYSLDKFFNLNETGSNVLDKHLHNLGFCPLDTSYFRIRDEIWNRDPASTLIFTRDIYIFGLTVKKYQLNEDVYQYYKSINEQLKAENRIFDPVSLQVRGNMTCENDPEEPVLGIFEVSSTSSRTYSFSPLLPNGSVKYKEINPLDIDVLAENGRLLYYPSFWIYNH